ncbi:hypothetical protein CORC01_11654 [Colletotrichum orchidophilum]|uniref:Uncharacterized protein n=1 Tax=Colletotrichum orchidophilum TaxID=1209926 RepID=A0A1G4AV81_9PEZI|nr:uncharacterized protein CORC01_11654 [Colletotrichum orchidophilum]OHE93015.1 hypothetical protein CORC01_11654 [Colletotrichum orchidophilum]
MSRSATAADKVWRRMSTSEHRNAGTDRYSVFAWAMGKREASPTWTDGSEMFVALGNPDAAGLERRSARCTASASPSIPDSTEISEFHHGGCGCALPNIKPRDRNPATAVRCGDGTVTVTAECHLSGGGQDGSTRKTGEVGEHRGLRSEVEDGRVS